MNKICNENELDSAIKNVQTKAQKYSQDKMKKKILFEQNQSQIKVDNDLRKNGESIRQQLQIIKEFIEECEENQDDRISQKFLIIKKKQIQVIENEFNHHDDQQLPLQSTQYMAPQLQYGTNNKEQIDTKTRLQRQDDKLDRMIDQTDKIKKIGLNIGEEITDQNRILEELESNVDKNSNILQKTNKLLTKIVLKSSTCKLMFITFVQLICIFLIIFYL